MNIAEFTDVIYRAQDVDSVSIKGIERPRHSALRRPCDARLRYTLLVGIALLAGWLAFTINSSINELEGQLEGIRANIVLPFSR